MIRQIIIPTENTFLLHLPDDLIGKKVEVIAFSADDITVEIPAADNPVRKTMDDARAFYTKNAVDFTKVEKWSREDLYE